MGKRVLYGFTVVSLLLCFVACSGGSGTDTANMASTGELSVGLTDATSNDFQAVYITIAEVSVSQGLDDDPEDGIDETWITVAEPNITVNLLELVNGVIEPLGLSELEAGDYAQMRLLLGDTPDDSTNIKDESHPFANYIIYGEAGEYLPLTVPSALQSGIKIVNGFTVEGDQETELVLDFDVMESIIRAGASGQWILKPTVKALEADSSAEVSGVIYDSTGTEEQPIPIEGAIINAQTSMGTMDSNIVTAATVSDESGGYLLLLKPGDYTLVVIKEGYQSASVDVTVAEGDAATQDFFLDPAEGTGTVYGKVEIKNGLDDQSVTVRIFNEDGDQVAAMSVANGGTYWFDLPPGLYSMRAVFTVDGEEMVTEVTDSFDISDGTVIEFDLLFENPDTGEGDDAGNTEKVTICHKGRAITVSRSALQAHLNHGDTEGACEAAAEDEDTGTEGEDADEDDTRVTICHKGKAITISESALGAHQAHGDTIGACEAAE